MPAANRIATLAATLLAAAASACSSTPSGTLALTTGGETDTFSRAPQPTSLHVDAVDAKGNVTHISQAALPATTIDLPDQDASETASVRITGLDATGNTLVWGQSLPFQFGALDGLTLDIFVQRTGELARMPNPLGTAPSAPLLTLVLGRYVVAAAGTASEIYDLLQWAPVDAPPTLPRAPLSLAAFGTQVLLIDASAATAFDLSDSTPTDIPVPAGGSYADVAGGATVVATDGTSFIVGATRAAGAPTASVLVVSTQGNLSFASLTTARAGAAATWVDGKGLVVTGGSAMGPGVEVLAEGGTSAVALAYPPDASTGGGAAPLDATHVLLAGGSMPDMSDPGVRSVDLGCPSACATAPWMTPPLGLASASVFALGATDALVVGGDANDATSAYRVSPPSSSGPMGAAVPVPFKVARSHARAIELPSGAVAVVGGDKTIESFATASP